MREYVTTLTRKGQVTIPGELRRVLGLQPKDKVAFELVQGEVRLHALGSRLIAGYGAVTPRRRPEDFRKVRLEIEAETGERAAGGS